MLFISVITILGKVILLRPSEEVEPGKHGPKVGGKDSPQRAVKLKGSSSVSVVLGHYDGERYLLSFAWLVGWAELPTITETPLDITNL